MSEAKQAARPSPRHRGRSKTLYLFFDYLASAGLAPFRWSVGRHRAAR